MIGPLIGMVHLGPLPGSPGYRGSMDGLVAAAVADARNLTAAGFDAVLIENYGDSPFFAEDVPDVTVAAMTRAATEVAAAGLPIGINVLRNDALAALSIAAAVGASFIRVNVLSGLMITDQGPIAGRAAEVARLRAVIHPGVQVFADIMVKHAVAPPGLDLETAARDTWERAGADALIISGRATGTPVPLEHLDRVRDAVPEAVVFVGSGATADTLPSVLAVADGVIVGTAVKEGGITTAPVDPERARRFAVAARG